MRTAATLILLGMLLAGSRPVAARPVPLPTTPDSTQLRLLPFEPAMDPGEPFAASKLNKTYGKDLTRLLRPGARPRRTDLEVLDRYAVAPEFVPAELDSSDIRLVGSRPEGSSTELTPEDKRETTPPQAGVRVGIPSSVATSATILGGIALFVKVLTEFLK
jgi:hypothetical protein